MNNTVPYIMNQSSCEPPRDTFRCERDSSRVEIFSLSLFSAAWPSNEPAPAKVCRNGKVCARTPFTGGCCRTVSRYTEPTCVTFPCHARPALSIRDSPSSFCVSRRSIAFLHNLISGEGIGPIERRAGHRRSPV